MNAFARVVRTVLVLFGAVTSIADAIHAESQPDRFETVAPERSAYDVRLLVAFDPSAFDATAQFRALQEIRQTAARCVGDLWSLDAKAITWLNPANPLGLQRVDLAVLSKQHSEERADIWFVAAIEARSAGFRISLRSWQPDVQSATIIVSEEVLDRRDLGVAVLRLCRDLFRPMGIVERVDDRSVRLRLRAGELSSPDPSFAQLAPDDVLIPMLAYRNKDRIIEKLQTIPWTYITVDEVEGSLVTGTVQSGLKLAIGGKKRGRIDTLVVALRPQHKSTRLALMTQSKPSLPLVAHRFEIRTQSVIPRPTEEHPDAHPQSTLLEEKLTDRLGVATISQYADHPLVWLFAYSGQHLLARVPFVPGSEFHSRLEVPDDATRLAAEADLQMLQGEVIDAVALRNTAIATVRAAAKKDDWITVNQKLTMLKEQQSVSTLRDRLTAVRVAGIAAAKSSRDKAAEVRIKRMCDEAVALVNTHLGSEKVRILSEEMEALQDAHNEAKEGN